MDKIVFDSNKIKRLTPLRKTCSDCNQEFILEPGEQYFYQSKGLHFPKRCSSCRAVRKAAIGSERND